MDWYPFQWCSGRGHGPHADLVFWWRVSEFTLNVSREAAFHRPVLHLYICSFFFVEGKPLTLIHTVNAAKPSFPTSIVGIIFTCFGWVGQGSPKQEGFKAYKFFLQVWPSVQNFASVCFQKFSSDLLSKRFQKFSSDLLSKFCQLFSFQKAFKNFSAISFQKFSSELYGGGLHVFVISLFRLRYFVMSPSLFRYVAFVISSLFVFSLSSFRLFVMAPSLCRREITKRRNGTNQPS